MADSVELASIQIGFKQRIMGRAPLLGTFVKTAAPQNIEILGSTGFDFIVVDQEHAPLGRETLDVMLLAAHARRLPALVRVANVGEIGHALDCGAAGIIAPHVTSAAQAEEVVAACRYAHGRRGYSNSPRAGDYGRVVMAEHVRSQDAAVIAVVMIEEAAAAALADAILAVDGIDATLIGCADLAVSLGERSVDTPILRQAVQKVSRSAAAAGRRVLAPVASISAARWLFDLGINALIVSSDQGLLRAAAVGVCSNFAELRSQTLDRVK
jgi:staphyloferrin B biosynthesis citrate synthase